MDVMDITQTPRDPFSLLVADVWLIIALNYPTVFVALTRTCQRLRNLLTNPKFVALAMQKFAKRIRLIRKYEYTEIYYILPNGQKHGIYEQIRNNNETRICLEHYVKGQRHGTYEEWNDQGVRTRFINYKFGNLHGTCEEYNNRGIRINLAHYVDGLLHGTYEVWNDQGTLMCLGHNVNGQPHGTFEGWNDQGVKIRHEHYIDGKKDSQMEITQ
jgi:antitoxin component YwqK of YwqJK toxin-antitoxin module